MVVALLNSNMQLTISGIQDNLIFRLDLNFYKMWWIVDFLYLEGAGVIYFKRKGCWQSMCAWKNGEGNQCKLFLKKKTACDDVNWP